MELAGSFARTVSWDMMSLRQGKKRPEQAKKLNERTGNVVENKGRGQKVEESRS
jgi:hypothetical protein